MSDFMKNDSEKNRLELIDYPFVEGIGRILTFGAKKYKAWNWTKAGDKEDIERIKGAMMRHALSYMNGDKIDDETGESHLYHMGCCMMFLDYFDRMGEEECNYDIDDIPQSYDPLSQWMRTTNENRNVMNLLEGSDFYFEGRDTETGHIVVYHPPTSSYIKFKNYDEFMEWLTTEHKEIYEINKTKEVSHE